MEGVGDQHIVWGGQCYGDRAVWDEWMVWGAVYIAMGAVRWGQGCEGRVEGVGDQHTVL